MSTPEGPRADAQVTVVDTAPGPTDKFYCCAECDGAADDMSAFFTSLVASQLQQRDADEASI